MTFPESTYLRFEEKLSPSAKTKVVSVISRAHSLELGSIKWYGPWRQYCFFPGHATIFNHTCMRTIVEVIDALMLEWMQQHS